MNALLMVDWREWAPQIIASIIGSSLIVTALTLSVSILNKPVISITATAATWPALSDTTKYMTDFTNTGHSQASHVRLTLFYPGTTIIGNSTIYKNENMTVKAEAPSSLAVFLPRLASGGHIKIMTLIKGIVNPHRNADVSNLGDYGSDATVYHYYHTEPFSIVATYDEGSDAFTTPLYFISPHYYFDTLIILIPTVLGFLAFAIGFRHKRKSVSKFAFNVLNDIKTVKRELGNVRSRTIISTRKWDPSHIAKHQFFNSYKDYQLTDNFYKSLERRDAHLSKTDLSQNDPLTNAEVLNKLKEQNMNCLTQAQNAYTNIKWTEFYKFDLLSGIPFIILGSFFITIISEGIPFFLLWAYPNTAQARWEFFPFPYFIITSFIARSMSGFFLVGAILHTTQGIRSYFPFSLSRSITFFSLSIVILGLPTMTIILYIENQRLLNEPQTPPLKTQSTPFKPVFDYMFKPVFDFIFSSSSSNSSFHFYLTALSLLFDVGRMFLLTWAAWAISKWYATKEIKEYIANN
jgi:hypothetical protein